MLETEIAALEERCNDVSASLIALKVKHAELKGERARLLDSSNKLFIENSRLKEELRSQIEQHAAKDTIIEAIMRSLEELEEA